MTTIKNLLYVLSFVMASILTVQCGNSSSSDGSISNPTADTTPNPESGSVPDTNTNTNTDTNTNTNTDTHTATLSFSKIINAIDAKAFSPKEKTSLKYILNVLSKPTRCLATEAVPNAQCKKECETHIKEILKSMETPVNHIGVLLAENNFSKALSEKELLVITCADGLSQDVEKCMDLSECVLRNVSNIRKIKNPVNCF